MIKTLVMALMVMVSASRDGDTLVVQVPSGWGHVEIETVPEAEFTHVRDKYLIPGDKGGSAIAYASPGSYCNGEFISKIYNGVTPANSGTVYGAICDEDSCTPVEAEFSVEGHSPASTPFHVLVVLAFLCGLLMLLMPCTLPAIGLKLAAFRGGSETPYVLGVLVAFMTLGLAAALLGAGLSHMSSWWYRAVLTVVCYSVALQFLGFLRLPGFGTTARNPFVLGLLSVALGSSCTVPFIAPVLVASSVLPAWQTVVLFVVMGVGFSCPFMLPIHRLLPKPGPWMVTYERVCGVAMLVVAGWLFTTLAPSASSPDYPTSGARVIVVTGDFCLNCKFVNPLWNSEEVQNALVERNLVVTWLDWSNGDKNITRLLDKHGVRAIPFALIVTPEGKETVLTGIYTRSQILDALD